MNAARAGRSVAGLACRRAGLAASAPLRRQTASKTTVAKKGVVGAPSTATRGGTGKAASSPPPPPPPPPPSSTRAGARAAPPELSTETRGKNLLFGAVLVGCVGASYFVTIRKMKEQDFLGDVEKEAEEEAQVNLHKSGLKVSAKVVPEKTEQTFSRAAASEATPSSIAATGASPKAASDAAVPNKEVEAATTELSEAYATPAAEAKVDEDAPTHNKKNKGWRKYWLFGPRVSGD